MDIGDTVRVRQPRQADEFRLATITDITYSTPHTTHIRDLDVQFPTGQERTYAPAEITVCTRTDDHAALIVAFTNTIRGLRDACRIAHDYDDQLSADIIGLLMSTYGTVATRLHVHLDPADLDTPTHTEQATRDHPLDPRPLHPAPRRGLRRRRAEPVHHRRAASVTCPDCPEAANLEAIPDDAVTGDPHVIDMLREAKAGHTRKIGGFIVDATTANAILTVYDAATPKSQAKIASLPIEIMAAFAWRVLRGQT